MINVINRYNYELVVQGDRLLLCFNQKYYQVGRSVFEVLKASRQAETIEQLYSIVADKDISNDQVSEIIKEKILPLFESSSGANASCSRLPGMENYWWTTRLLKADVATEIAKIFTPLFKGAFPFIFIAITVLNCFACLWMFSNYSSTLFPAEETLQIIIVYLLLSLILFCHELGHIAASSSEKLRPKEIGAGLYFIMPMMYVDLTEAWSLSKMSRVKINLGGITTQMIFNIVLIVIFLICDGAFLRGIFFKLTTVNIIIIIVNLIPFFKFDGYWILSDLTDIPNLLKESNGQIVRFFVKKSPFKVRQNSFSFWQRLVLSIYSIFRLIFVFFMILMLFAVSVQAIIKSVAFFSNIGNIQWDVNTVFMVLNRILVMGILAVILFKISKPFFRRHLNNK